LHQGLRWCLCEEHAILWPAKNGAGLATLPNALSQLRVFAVSELTSCLSGAWGPGSHPERMEWSLIWPNLCSLNRSDVRLKSACQPSDLAARPQLVPDSIA